jgi:hypothetical protein
VSHLSLRVVHHVKLSTTGAEISTTGMPSPTTEACPNFSRIREKCASLTFTGATTLTERHDEKKIERKTKTIPNLFSESEQLLWET